MFLKLFIVSFAARLEIEQINNLKKFYYFCFVPFEEYEEKEVGNILLMKEIEHTQ